jgi:hypothetical protein
MSISSLRSEVSFYDAKFKFELHVPNSAAASPAS